MAYFEVRGMDSFLQALGDYEKHQMEKLPAMVEAAGDFVVDRARETGAWSDRTGQLRQGIVRSKVYKDGRSCYCEVYPTGTTRGRKKPQRLAEIGFVLEYGRPNMPPRPWLRPAIEDNSQEILDVMERVWASE